MSLTKTSLIATAIAATSFVFPATANANMTSTDSLVNPEAVRLLTTSVQDAVAAHDTLLRGNVTAASAKLDSAVRKLNTVVSKDRTLGLTYQDTDNPLKADSFKTELQAVRSTLRKGDAAEARQSLERVLSNAGVV